MEEIFDHPVLGPVTLRKSPRIKRISLSVRPSGQVRLTFPPRMTRRALAFLESRVEWVAAARTRLAERAKSTIPPPDEAAREALRAEAEADLPARVERLSAAADLPYRSLRIGAARSRWGSCNGRNMLALSLFVMALPEHLRDYIVLHELSHTVHHDHSPRFHELLDRHTRRLLGRSEKELRKELRGYHIGR